MDSTISHERGAFEIDPRSFHVFEYRGSKLLFDRATGSSCALNDTAYEILQLCKEHPYDKAIGLFSQEHDGVDAKAIEGLLRDLKARGFFRFTEADKVTSTYIFDKTRESKCVGRGTAAGFLMGQGNENRKWGHCIERRARLWRALHTATNSPCDMRIFSSSLMRRHNASSVRVGLEKPQVGKTELLPM